MIRIKPDNGITNTCPDCGGSVEDRGVEFTGMHVLNRIYCSKCGEFLIDMPAGHGKYYKTSYSLRDRKGIIDNSTGQWFLNTLINTAENNVNPEISLVRITKRTDKVIIISAIDVCYGHSLLRLMTSIHYARYLHDNDMLILIPRKLLWMVPDFIDNVIAVDIKESESDCFINGLDRAVKEITKKYRDVFLAEEYEKIYMHKDISKFTGIEVRDHDSIMNGPMQIGFIWRENRVWSKSSRFARIMLSARRRIWKYFPDIMLKRQYHNVKALFERMHSCIPDAHYYIAGFGKYGSFPSYIDDRRVNTINSEIETEWVQLYRDSSLIIGIHGSNMIIPSAYSAMTLNLMPIYKWQNMAEDIMPQDEGNPFITLFRYRLIPMDVSVETVALIAVSMIGNYGKFRKRFIYSDKEIKSEQ